LTWVANDATDWTMLKKFPFMLAMTALVLAACEGKPS
jgi:hypothetical protein